MATMAITSTTIRGISSGLRWVDLEVIEDILLWYENKRGAPRRSSNGYTTGIVIILT